VAERHDQPGLFEPVLSRGQQRQLWLLIGFWLVGLATFWIWWLRPGHWVSAQGALLNGLVMAYLTACPLITFGVVLRMRRLRRDLQPPQDLRVAMVVTKAASEPWALVQATLEGMQQQQPSHDTWLADEAPDAATQRWCQERGVQISCRRENPDYHNPDWPRRRACKEGNLAYFYDHYGYANYDVVVQLDADHIPQPGYLEAMLRPFSDAAIGYVAAPSIVNRNASSSWSARARTYSEALLHGPVQLGLNGGWAPLCFGSHYAVRTQALNQIGGLGPELAEDHSTTLMLQAAGWRGAFAENALCLGLGPHSFQDLMVQDYQWARSLFTLLLRHSPRWWGELPLKLRLQAVAVQLFYPSRCAVGLLSWSLPLLAIGLNQPWVQVDLVTFVIASGCLTVLLLTPRLWLRQQGLFSPPDSPVLSWEALLLDLCRLPWITAGLLAALREAVVARPRPFQVTNKRLAPRPLPLRFVLPYGALSLVFSGGIALLAESSSPAAQGYVLLSLIAAALMALAALVVTGLAHRSGTAALQPFLRHYGLGLSALALVVVNGIAHHDILLRPVHLPLLPGLH
jgi:cellulose synthase (UDP-forming)